MPVMVRLTTIFLVLMATTFRWLSCLYLMAILLLMTSLPTSQILLAKVQAHYLPRPTTILIVVDSRPSLARTPRIHYHLIPRSPQAMPIVGALGISRSMLHLRRVMVFILILTAIFKDLLSTPVIRPARNIIQISIAALASTTDQMPAAQITTPKLSRESVQMPTALLTTIKRQRSSYLLGLGLKSFSVLVAGVQPSSLPKRRN